MRRWEALTNRKRNVSVRSELLPTNLYDRRQDPREIRQYVRAHQIGVYRVSQAP